jgi:hypothetical protein
MYSLAIVRHGHKNNDPEAHGTGVEALLDPTKLHLIKRYAAQHADMVRRDVLEALETETTIIKRAIVTGEVGYEAILAYLAYLPEDEKKKISVPTIDALIGSSGIHPRKGTAINLDPNAITKIWKEAKKQDDYKGQEGEHRPLYAWCEQGFDNPQANNHPQDPGISLREIACRIGTYAYEKIQHYIGTGQNKGTIAFGHSGDIEPFLYLCFEMLNGQDGTNPDAMTKWFRKTGGALEPLTGIRFEYENDKELFLIHPVGQPGKSVGHNKITMPLEILQEQARWFREDGRSEEVLEAKIALEG